MKDSYLFYLDIKMDKLHYIPSNSSNTANLIGIRALTDFSRFQPEDNSIIFKRTSILYMVYLFFGYFFIVVLGMILFCRKNIFASMKFVHNIFNWAFFKDNNARIEVLRTEL